MDSLTQIVLGAAVGEAVLGKKAGNKAILYGAIAGTIPDLDVLAGQFLDTVGRLEVHRGLSHSLFFAIAASPLLGKLVNRLHRKLDIGWKHWSLLFFLGLTTHVLLDCFTTWGTQVFWPFDYRVAWGSIFVIDPLYTLPFLGFLIAAAFRRKEDPWRHKLNRIGLIVSSSYLVLTLVFKGIIGMEFEQALQRQNIEYLRFETRPSPLNSILWTANVETEEGFYIGYRSIMDDDDDRVQFNYFPKNHDILDPVRNHPRVARLLEITGGWYSVEKIPGGYQVNDLRFGVSDGFLNEQGNFVFAYPVTVDASGNVQSIEQARNSFRDSERVLAALWQRIWGPDVDVGK